MVGLIDHKQIPAFGLGQLLLPLPPLRQVARRQQHRPAVPRVRAGRHLHLAVEHVPQHLSVVPQDVQGKLLVQLLLPLLEDALGDQDQRPPDPARKQQLPQDQTRLDGLAQLHLGDRVEPPEPGQAGPGEEYGVELPLGHLPKAGVHVAADIDDLQAQAQGGELGDPARRAGADPGTPGELAQAEPVAGDEHVARILTSRDGRQRDPVLGVGGEVLQGVHGHVDLAAQQRVTQRADEDAHAAEGRKRRRRGIARGDHVDQVDLAVEPRAQRVGDARALGARQQRGARPHPQRPAHGRPSARVTAATASGSRENSSARALA